MFPLTHIDLFSGIGGFALAARWAGFETKCFSEIDTYASAVLRKHWPDTPNLGDITKADFGPYAGTTLLTGGFPCQPFSVAGKQRGKEDDRFLWPRMLEVIAEVRPAWVVGENVAGIVRMELDRVLADLEGQGYTAVPLVIPACAVDAKHRRDRVWIVANTKSSGTGADNGGLRESPGGASRGEGSTPSEIVADNQSLGRGEMRGRASGPGGHADERGEAMADSNGEGLNSRQFSIQPRPKHTTTKNCCQWPAEPGVCRVVNGLPRRVDRIKGLGNAIVPQVAFEILKAIAAAEANH